MSINDILTMVLSKVPEDKKEAFLEEVRDQTVRKDAAFLEKYGIELSAEELEKISSNEITDEELDEAAGGCMCMCAQANCELTGVN